MDQRLCWYKNMEEMVPPSYFLGILNVLTQPMIRAAAHLLRGVMRLFLDRRIVWMAFFLGISGMGYSQGVMNKPLTLNLQQVSLKAAIDTIASQSGVTFVYTTTLVDKRTLVTIQVQQQPLQTILDILLRPRGITYELPEGSVHAEETHIVLKQASTKVSGHVLNVTQEPVPGANVIILGTSQGVTTDANGYYKIAADSADALVFSFIGLATQEIPVGNQQTIDVTLKEDVTNLNELVVSAGYWQVSKWQNTGSIVKVSADEIARQSMSNPLLALAGKMPGVFVEQQSGVPASSVNLQIRGSNSVRLDGNYPLYLVDGVPYPSVAIAGTVGQEIIPGANQLNMINPQDIASIEVLKDADATAIYGSRGANGVVLITLKHGEPGKTTFDVNLYSGVGRVGHFVDLLNTSQYVMMREEAFENDNRTNQASDYDLNGTWTKERYTDWQKKLLGGTAHHVNAQVSASGGNEHTQFLISSNYWEESTVYPGDFNFQRGTTHLTLHHTTRNNKFKTNLSTLFSMAENKLPSQDLTNDAITLPPNAPRVYDGNGDLNWHDGSWENPMAKTKSPYEAETYLWTLHTSFAYQLMDPLTVKMSIGYSSITDDNAINKPVWAKNPYSSSALNSSTSVGHNDTRNWIIEPQAEYSRSFPSGKLAVSLGATWQDSKRAANQLDGYSTSGEALFDNIHEADFFEETARTYIRYRYAGIFLRANYNLFDKYILNLTGRRDGSSRFGAGNRFANFGAVGAAWIFSEEPWLNHWRFLTFGKWRTSYGITGNDQIGDYRYLDTYGWTDQSYLNPALIPVRLANPKYAWEENRKFETALELEFWKSRVALSVAWYHHYSTNQLISLPLPYTTGFTVVQSNLPVVIENMGLEVDLEATLVTTEHLSWKAGVNLTIPRSNVSPFPYLAELSAYSERFEVNQPYNILKLYHVIGVDKNTGVYEVRDVNDDGSYSSEDKTVYANVGPKLYGGINTEMAYKRWTLNILMQVTFKESYGLQGYYDVPGAELENQPVGVLKRWQEPGDDTRYMKFSTSTVAGLYDKWQESDAALADLSFLRLRNVSLSWKLPARWREKLKLQQSNVYIRGYNVFTITSYKGFDPEIGNPNVLPLLQLFSVGLQVKF